MRPETQMMNGVTIRRWALLLFSVVFCFSFLFTTAHSHDELDVGASQTEDCQLCILAANFIAQMPDVESAELTASSSQLLCGSGHIFISEFVHPHTPPRAPPFLV